MISLSAVALASVRIATPYLAATMGGIWSEKSGVINVALEGTILAGALATAAVTLATGSIFAGLAAGLVAGMCTQLLHGVAVVVGRADAIVSGLAVNLLAAASTRSLLRALYGSSSNSPTIPASIMAHAPATMTALLVALAVAATIFALSHTAFGLRARAAGECPEALAAVGLSVSRTRLISVAIAGALCGLAGAWLVFDQGAFGSGMSGGRGFIALAAVVVSGWRPGRAALYCLIFGFAEALQIALQDQQAVAHQLIQTLPYVATLLALAVGFGRARPPAALGSNS